jgi:Mn2+/Fe2+ NRAMP family transporter
MLGSSGAVVLIPGAPLITITMFVQVVAVTLLPAALVFLLLLLNDRPLMGDHVNTRWQNVMNWSIVAIVIVMSTLLGVGTLFPDLFR